MVEEKESSVKLLMAWDVRAGHEQEYFKFISTEFVDGLMRLGLVPAEAWHTMYGRGPQVQADVLAKDLETLQEILDSPDWARLKERLLRHVKNYREKIVKSTSRFHFIK